MRPRSPRVSPARPLLLVLLLALWAPRLGAQEPERAAPPPPNLLLVTLEATRPDRLGCYGYAQASTPHIDALAAQGLRFERAYTHAPLTLPAHASLLSGRTPLEHGIHDDGRYALSPRVPLLAERLRQAGYSTAAFVGTLELKRIFGLDRGFDLYDDELGAPADSKAIRTRRSAREQGRGAAAWIASRGERPFFCWVQLAEARAPLAATPGATDEPADLYDAALARMDAALGDLLAALDASGVAERTLVVLVGSMGEALGAHGESTHGALVHEETLRVPLVVRAPGGAAGASEALVGHADLAPTLLELLGMQPLEGATGASFAALARGEADPAPERQVYFESEQTALAFGWSTLRGLIRGDWKYVRAPEPRLHRLSQAGEAVDLAAEEPELVDELEAALAARIAAGRARAARPAPVLSTESRRYAAFDTEPPLASADGALHEGAGVDPRERIAAVEAWHEARQASFEGRTQDMYAPLERAADASPDTAMLQAMLAIAYERAHRFEDAKARLELALELDPRSSIAAFYMARMVIQTGKPEEAEAWYQLAAELDPRSQRAQMAMALRLSQAQRLDDSVPYLERLVEIEPEQLRNWEQLLYVHSTAKRWAGLAEVARRAALEFPDNLAFPNYRAWALAVAPDAAVRDPKTAVELATQLAERTEMQDPGILDTLAAAQAAGGDFEAAKKTVQKGILLAHQLQVEPLLTDMRARLALYAKGEAYVERD